MIVRICWLTVCLVALLSGSATAFAQSVRPPYDPSDDIILEWNQVLLDANAGDSRLLLKDQGGPARDSRASAIQQLLDFGGDGIQYPTLRSKQQTVTGIFWPYDASAGIDSGIAIADEVYNSLLTRRGHQ